MIMIRHVPFLAAVLAFILIFCSMAKGVSRAPRQVYESNPEFVILAGEITPVTAISFAMNLEVRRPPIDDVKVLINSPGGRTDAGDKMLVALRRYARDKKLICYGTGTVASMAFNIMSQCDVRIGAAHTEFMMHDPYRSYDVKGQESFTRTYKQMKEDLADLAGDVMRYREINRKALGLTKKQIDIISDKGDKEYTSQELLANGWLNRIGEPGT